MILFLGGFSSCEKWLDIQPSDRLTDKQLFNSREGFLKALNGVYVELVDRSIYGRYLTSDGLDRMAQLYRGSGNRYNNFRNFNYSNNDLKLPFERAWNKLYSLIANCNMIIEHAGDANPNLQGVWFGIVKGEALALRAFFHLDLLRLYGPHGPYSENGARISIPYTTGSDRKTTPLLSAEEVLTLIISDLKEAIELLKIDPIISSGVMNEDDPIGGNELRYRQYRLNQFAARALLARAYLWGGKTNEAYATATNLLNEVKANNIFPWITSTAVNDGSNPDRIFSSEVMFAVYDQSRNVGIFSAMFEVNLPNDDFVSLGTPNTTTLYAGRIAELYPDQNDWRFTRGWASNTMVSGTARFIYQKYRETNDPSSAAARRFRYMIPLMRITEVYLIAAESASNLEESKGYLEEIWRNRNFNLGRPTITDISELARAIEWESRRELLAEGQMFYFYKRRATNLIPNGDNTGVSTTYITMNLNNYVVPLPDSETQFREDINK